MLADPRSRALVTNFAGQWLYLRNLDVDHARHAAVPGLRRQPAAGVPAGDGAVLREHPARRPQRARSADGATTRSSTSGWRGTTASRTSTAAASAASTFDDGQPARRAAAQGSILTVTSYATRTSPVIRGKWVLENILGAPPPPPPPDVPALKDNTVDGQPAPMRERLAQHRANPACAGCHKLMDPVGLRARELRRRRPLAHHRGRRSRSMRPAACPTAASSTASPGSKQALLQRPELFVGTLTEKLLTYRAGPRRRIVTMRRRSARSCATRGRRTIASRR